MKKEKQWEMLDCKRDQRIRTGRQQLRELFRSQRKLHKKREAGWWGGVAPDFL